MTVMASLPSAVQIRACPRPRPPDADGKLAITDIQEGLVRVPRA